MQQHSPVRLISHYPLLLLRLPTTAMETVLPYRIYIRIRFRIHTHTFEFGFKFACFTCTFCRNFALRPSLICTRALHFNRELAKEHEQSETEREGKERVRERARARESDLYFWYSLRSCKEKTNPFSVAAFPAKWNGEKRLKKSARNGYANFKCASNWHIQLNWFRLGLFSTSLTMILTTISKN